MKGKRLGMVGAVLLSLLLVFSFSLGCAPKETIKIGHIAEFTGDLSFTGEPYQAAALLAVEKVNAAGGVLGKQIELITEDGATDPKTNVDALQKLITIDKVQALIGGVTSSGSIAMSATLKLNKVVMISPGASSPAVTTMDDGDFYFRTSTSDTLMGAALAALAWDKGYKTANVLSRNDDYGVGLETVFVSAFEKLGGEVLVTVRYDPKAPDYSGYLIDVTSEPADVIEVNCLMEDGARAFKGLYDMGMMEKYKFLVSESGQDPGIVAAVGADVMVGIGGAIGRAVETGTFREDFTASYGIEPASYEANVYDNIILLALAIEMAGQYDGTAIRDNLRAVANPPGIEVNDVAEALKLVREGTEINYLGAGGEITFDENGDVFLSTARVWEWDKDGNMVYTGEIIEVR